MLKHFLETNSIDVFFVRNSFRRYIYIAYFCLIINYCLTAYLYYDLVTEKKSTFFATTTDGRIIDIFPE